jgi:hypothetical protein
MVCKLNPSPAPVTVFGIVNTIATEVNPGKAITLYTPSTVGSKNLIIRISPTTNPGGWVNVTIAVPLRFGAAELI